LQPLKINQRTVSVWTSRAVLLASRVLLTVDGSLVAVALSTFEASLFLILFTSA
jgi:hypothetical protein